MSAPDWNLAAYMACLGQKTEAMKPQENFNASFHRNQNGGIEEQKVFSELRPATRLPQNYEAHEVIDSMHQCIRVRESGIRNYDDFQTLNGNWDMHSVSNGNEGPVSGRGYALQPPSKFNAPAAQYQTVQPPLQDNTTIHNIVRNTDVSEISLIQDFQSFLSLENNYDLVEDEFKFPACVEEEYNSMVQACTQGVAQKLPCIETIFSMAPQKFGKENTEAYLTRIGDSDNKNNIKKSTVLLTAGNDASRAQKIKAPNVRLCESQEVNREVPLTELQLARDSEEHVEAENIDFILDLINPSKDIMGKTFHKIPSTQPIYNDNDVRQCEDDDENRIRRPMNAFMLWARKYRSLVAKEFSEASNSEISVKLGEIWNELSSEQQRPYFQKAETLKADHKQNYPNYVYQPRQARAKTSKRSRVMNRNDDNAKHENTRIIKPAVQDLASKSSFSYTPKLTCMHEIGHVASTVVISQDGTELDLAQHVSRQPRIMAPKPVYPKGMQPHSRTDNVKDEQGDFQRVEDNAGQITAIAKDSHSRCYEQDSYDENEIGILRDVMLPCIDKYTDDYDLVSEAFTSFDVTDLDAYLAGVNSEFGKYIERQNILDEDVNLSRKAKRTGVAGRKRPRTVKSENGVRKKPRTQKCENFAKL